ncbi:hypothetical protein SAMN04488072_105158 [Lentibacillus halodurans]|uniref:Uncharacterized protein n=1 Tax=Lentibacillus halodurans TaxID=237679 RepID=A0A1I0XP28_9BACI|nr:hypothetical protein SAMN04488072_105158 [Lentibacillus halodurans]
MVILPILHYFFATEASAYVNSVTLAADAVWSLIKKKFYS